MQWAGAPFCCSDLASHHTGFSCCGVQALGHTDFSSCGSWTLAHRLGNCHAQAQLPCGIFLARDQTHITCIGNWIPALATGPPRKSNSIILFSKLFSPLFLHFSFPFTPFLFFFSSFTMENFKHIQQEIRLYKGILAIHHSTSTLYPHSQFYLLFLRPIFPIS